MVSGDFLVLFAGIGMMVLVAFAAFILYGLAKVLMFGLCVVILIVQSVLMAGIVALIRRGHDWVWLHMATFILEDWNDQLSDAIEWIVD